MNGAMDPELFRIAQEQMSRMSPADFSRIQQQMMSNPDLMRMASENMRNLRPEDLKIAAEQLKNSTPADMAHMSEMMANASPADIASMRARFDAQVNYEIVAAQRLKNQGNELHKQGRYKDASEKYLSAIKTINGVPSSKASDLSMMCSLNLMSCYMKTNQYEECIEEGSKVLKYDANNVKALYRRGQAYKELGMLKNAVLDLKKALQASPDDETIAQVLREAEKKLSDEEVHNRPMGVIIEEITEDEDKSYEESKDHLLPEPSTDSEFNSRTLPCMENKTHSELLGTLMDDPEATRSFQSFISNTEPETLAGLSGGKVGEISPEMFKTATNLISKMSPDEFQRMMNMASQFHNQNSTESSSPASISAPPAMSPEMLKTAANMMDKMSPEELQEMFKMASSFRENGTLPGRPTSSSESLNGELGQRLNEKASSSGGTSRPILPSFDSDMQDRMRDQMKDPATRQMLASMMKNVNPEMLSNMSEQLGMKLSREDAERAQHAMSSMSPETMEKLLLWSDRIQRGLERARRARQWLLGNQGIVLALCVLIFAAVLRWWWR